jgi:MFS family permease
MSVTADELVAGRSGGVSWLWRRQLESYPNTGPRVTYLAITVLATIMLYYELYVGGSVSTLILVNLHMSFTFFVITLAFGNLIGAFGSLFAGLTDRLGRANLVVFGLLFTGIFVAFVLPAATSKWVFTIEGFVVGVVEGICLVATPALIRDFSPQVGRATAMGFWTSGPVLGSLIVAVVGTATVPAIVHDPRFWTHEYRICGIAGLVVFVVALIGLRELSPQLRDQLMVTMRDRALIEAKAKGIDIEAALRHPFRQLLKPDVVVSAFAVSVMLLIYYTAVGFSVIYLTTVFGFSLKDANGLGNWNWGFNVIAVILIGVFSDRVRVRKPFMLVGGIAAAIMVVIYLLQAGLQPSYYTLAVILALLSFSLGVAYTPWMASFTETVEAHNPALTATGLAIWGWIIRVVVFASFMLIPVVINSVTPLVNYGGQVQAIATKYKTALDFATAHPNIVALAQKYKVQLTAAQQFKPELTALQTDTVDVGTVFLNCATPSKTPKAVMAKAVAAAGGGTTGTAVLTTMCQNAAAINGVIKVAGSLQKIAPYAAPLTALSKIPASDLAYLKAHATDVQNAANKTVGQWKYWYWICFGGVIFFLLSIPILRGRWKTSDAKRDEEEHERMVDAELAALNV